jgi:hypothetical protein
MMQRNLFGHSIGGHDRVRGVVAAVQPAVQLVHHVRDTDEHLVHR